MTTFSEHINALHAEHQAKDIPFFAHLASVDPAIMRDPSVLEELYRRYQAGMHATRVMVYMLPHLDTPALRTRKLQIYIDDDGLPGGDTHHAQLRRAFADMGAGLDASDDDRYGDLDLLANELDPSTARFVKTVKTLYTRSLGAWCVTENFSDDWLHAFADALAVHHPSVRDATYFAECFAEGVEERHGEESLNITEDILSARADLTADTFADAKVMADALRAFWVSLDEVLVEAERARA